MTFETGRSLFVVTFETRASILRAAKRRAKMAGAIAEAVPASSTAVTWTRTRPVVRESLPISVAQALALDANPGRMLEAQERLRIRREGEAPLGPCQRCKYRPRAPRSPYCSECDWTLPSRG